MEISIPAQLEEQINLKVASGMYADASDVVRESLRMTFEHEAKKEKLRQMVQEGFDQIDRGETIKVTNREHFKKLARKQNES